MAGCCEHGNEPSISVRGWEFLDQASTSYSSPWSSLRERSYVKVPILSQYSSGMIPRTIELLRAASAGRNSNSVSSTYKLHADMCDRYIL